MPDPRLLESLTLLVAHVESLEPLNSWQELYPVSSYWKFRFNILDALLKKLCELAGITIERAPEAPFFPHLRTPDSSWFEGSTFLEYRRLTKHQIIQAKLMASAVVNRADWIRRMELLKVKVETARVRSQRKPAVARKEDTTATIRTDAEGQFMDRATAARGKWLLREYKKGTTYGTMLILLPKQSKNWEAIHSVSGVRAALKAYCQKMNIKLPPRKKGRPAKKRTKA